MAVLVSAYDRGVLFGRCDANCYDSKGGDCNCVCRGSNHGLGLRDALANTAAKAASWQKMDRQERRSRSVSYEMPLLRQASLF